MTDALSGSAPAARTPEQADAHARAAASAFDRHLHARLAPLSAGLSPIALGLAGIDWAWHLMSQPAQAARLGAAAQAQALAWWREQATRPVPGGAEAMRERLHEAALDALDRTQAWWDDATDLRGMRPHHRDVAAFQARRWLDLFTPGVGLPWADPQVWRRARETGGRSLADGRAQVLDVWRERVGLPPLRPPATTWRVGQELALTPGRVVHRNHLAELIQYAPTTPRVDAAPVFIVPSWIMKYYILDLRPEDSLVKWLTDQGHTVFILSWRDPDPEDALLSMEDYLEAGIFDALAAIAREVPGQPVQAAGYCLGGTLLAIGAAAMARPGGVEGQAALPALVSLTLLAAEVDFAEPGEMGVLIDEEQVAWLEDQMAERGYLTGAQMGGSFAYLHARELVWLRELRRGWLGEPETPNDLMAWNADVTRMPAAMHSEYLRRCYLRNEIATGRFPVQGRPVSLTDLRLPVFLVCTERDHVAPWPAVYRFHHLCPAEVTMVMASGGHNAGIVSEPGRANRLHRVRVREAFGPWVPPQDWAAGAQVREGSWWPTWQAWLRAHGGARVPARAPRVDGTLGPAPGRFVLERHRD
jgi:polyhydroxyalkanoate synthase